MKKQITIALTLANILMCGATCEFCYWTTRPSFVPANERVASPPVGISPSDAAKETSVSFTNDDIYAETVRNADDGMHFDEDVVVIVKKNGL